MGTIFVDNLEPQSGTSLTLGASGDTISVASGAKTFRIFLGVPSSNSNGSSTDASNTNYLSKVVIRYHFQ